MKKKSLARVFPFALALASCLYLSGNEVMAEFNATSVKKEFSDKFADKLDDEKINSIFSSDDPQIIKANVIALADAQEKLAEQTTSSIKAMSKRKKKSLDQVNRSLLELAKELHDFAKTLDSPTQKQTENKEPGKKKTSKKKSLEKSTSTEPQDEDDESSITPQPSSSAVKSAKQADKLAEIRQLSASENVFDTVSNNIAVYEGLRKDSKYNDEMAKIKKQIGQAKDFANKEDLSDQLKAIELVLDCAKRLSTIPVYALQELTTADCKDIFSAIIKEEIGKLPALADGIMNAEIKQLISLLDVKISFNQRIKLIADNARQFINSMPDEEDNQLQKNLVEKIQNTATLQNENLSTSAKITKTKDWINSYNKIAKTPTHTFLPVDESVIDEIYVNLWNDYVLKLLEKINPIIAEEKEEAKKLHNKFSEEHSAASLTNSKAKEKLEEEYKKKLAELESSKGNDKSKARKRKEYEIAHKKDLNKLEENTDSKHITALSADSYLADLEELEEEIETTCKQETNLAELKDDTEKLMDSTAEQLAECLKKCDEVKEKLDSKIKSGSDVASFEIPFTEESIKSDVAEIKKSLARCKKNSGKKDVEAK
ncbi:MAG: hypothetical protein LBT67_00885 [Holosporaceae bacterium]|jgi:hypothetical protein|nr:hypothetical protein [Holosporaceae bacterium]